MYIEGCLRFLTFLQLALNSVFDDLDSFSENDLQSFMLYSVVPANLTASKSRGIVFLI
jgi:hypothetical protein